MASHRLTIELLELRRPFDVDAWHNIVLDADVDGDGLVNPSDALIVINDLNRFGPRSLEHIEPEINHATDTNGDDVSSAIDLLTIINLLNFYSTSAHISAVVKGDFDGNGVVLNAATLIEGVTVPDAHVVGKVGQLSVETEADAAGLYSIPVELEAGLTTVVIEATDPRGRKVGTSLDVRLGNAIDNWNATALNVIRAWTAVSNDPYQGRIVPSQPPMAARNLAMIHIAMFDAANAVEQKYQSYLSDLPVAPDGMSAIAAATAAAYTVSTALYGDADERSLWDAAVAESLQGIADNIASDSWTFGTSVGKKVLNLRATDGAKLVTTYPLGDEPGEWRRTYPDFLPPLLPQWPKVTPFSGLSIEAVRPPAPPALDTEAYAQAVDQVMRLGALQNSARSSEQTEIALFWADGGGTATPPGHWNRIAADVAMSRGMPLVDDARMFALLNIAMADAGIASWDAKYTYGLWRPIDAIRQGNVDGNTSTVGQADWLPLLKTPPFPSYTSGHSTFSGAAATVLTAIFGDAVSFESTTDPQNAPSQRPLGAQYINSRHFVSFWQAAGEAGLSRIYGGIHFSFDNTAGLQLGSDVADAALMLLQPIHT